MIGWLKLSHHRHSGRLQPHQYTSYGPLALLLVVTGVCLSVASASAAQHPGPISSSISLTGTMPGKPPVTAATIRTPVNGQHFSTSPIDIKGSCPANTLVEIYKNDIFAGSAPCSASGEYDFEIDLLLGQNVLVARVYNDLNEQGPDSQPVTVYYDALPTQSASIVPLSFGGGQMLLYTDAVYRGVFPGQTLSVPITIMGGTAPYALSISWGDGTSSIISRSNNLTFNADHVYKKPGTYQITIQATDTSGRVAFLTVAAIVNGQPTVVTATTTGGPKMSRVLMLWPLYTASIAVVLSFWLGERREKHLLLGSGPLYHVSS